MSTPLKRLLPVLAMLGALAPAVAHADRARARVDENAPPLTSASPSGSSVGVTPQGGWSAPSRRAVTPVVPYRPAPVLVCDAFGRCWQQVQPYYYDGGRYRGRW